MSISDRYVTDEQRSSRPIINATRAEASWLFFRVARSTRMTQIWALRSRLEKQPTDLRRDSRDLGDGTLASLAANEDQKSVKFSSREKLAVCKVLQGAVKLPPSRGERATSLEVVG